MKERVMKARSIGLAAIAQRARRIAQPDFDLYMTDQIDEATLKQRKSEARKSSTEECEPLATLDLAFAAFAEAVAARVASKQRVPPHSSLPTTSEVPPSEPLATLDLALQQLECGV